MRVSSLPFLARLRRKLKALGQSELGRGGDKAEEVSPRGGEVGLRLLFGTLCLFYYSLDCVPFVSRLLGLRVWGSIDP